jgi:hypothetical protein
MSRRPPRPPAHRGNHSGLLSFYPSEGQAKLDAIIVPTIRKAAAMRDAFELAAALQCPVVALCSRWARTNEVLAEANVYGVRVYAIDVTNCAALPEFSTSMLLKSPRLNRFAQNSDLSFKRNLGLVLARMSGWERILFLDDDMTNIQPSHIAAAAYRLHKHSVVALWNHGYPDNSVICHALRKVRRQVGIIQHSFVGGGAMAVAVDRADSFFPNIYNEDWFFMLGYFAREPGRSPIAVTGSVAQRGYDPFVQPDRARDEELGDCLAEGVYALLDDRESIEKADRRYWTAFLADRRILLRKIHAAVLDLDVTEAERRNMIASVKAAEGRNQFINQGLCAEYLRRWQLDRRSWLEYLTGLPQPDNTLKALDHLGLTPARQRGSAQRALV